MGPGGGGGGGGEFEISMVALSCWERKGKTQKEAVVWSSYLVG